jgi:hypothetical protein
MLAAFADEGSGEASGGRQSHFLPR